MSLPACGWTKFGSFFADAVPYAPDLNGNGRADLLLANLSNRTPILEQSVPTDSAVRTAANRLSITPNPFRGAAQITWARSSSTLQRCSVYDAGGRLIETRRVAGGSFEWPLHAVPSGVYFVKVEDPSGTVIARGKALAAR